MRLSIVHLLEMYNSGIFRNGRRKHIYDQKFINLLLLELVGLDDIQTDTSIDNITMKFMHSKYF